MAESQVSFLVNPDYEINELMKEHQAVLEPYGRPKMGGVQPQNFLVLRDQVPKVQTATDLLSNTFQFPSRVHDVLLISLSNLSKKYPGLTFDWEHVS